MAKVLRNEEMLINSIYKATEGEGVFIGTPQVFLRFQGCQIGCLNCDSKDTWEFNDSYELSLGEVKEKIKNESYNFSIKRLSITGGDPLHPKFDSDLKTVIKWVKSLNMFVNIEAAGTRVVDSIFDNIDFISFDIKTPSTGVETPLRNIEKMLKQYSEKCQIKSVIQDQKDFNYILGLKEKLPLTITPWVLTPCYNLNEEFPTRRFQDIIEWNEKSGAPFRVIGQQHKWIFGPDQKQV